MYVDCACQFLLLRFSKNHVNQFNRFNQVALVEMTPYGQVLGAYEAKALQLGHQAADNFVSDGAAQDFMQADLP